MKKILTGLIFSLFLIQNAFAAIPYTFTNGVVADATEVNSNFNYFEGKFSTTSGHAHTGSDSKTLSTLGTITTGVWQGTIIDEVYGGTGLGTYASGDLIYATSNTDLARKARGSDGSIFIASQFTKEPEWLAPGTSGYFLQTQGAGVNPQWAQVMQYTDTRYRTATYFDYDTATASGDLSITGIGFAPKGIIISGGIDSTVQASYAGSSDGTTNTCLFKYSGTGNGQNTVQCIDLEQDTAGGISTLGRILTLGSDGYTITFTKNGAKTGTARFLATCWR